MKYYFSKKCRFLWVFRVALVFFGKLTVKKGDIYYGVNISLKNGAMVWNFFLKCALVCSLRYEILIFWYFSLRYEILIFWYFSLPFVMFGTAVKLSWSCYDAKQLSIFTASYEEIKAQICKKYHTSGDLS